MGLFLENERKLFGDENLIDYFYLSFTRTEKQIFISGFSNVSFSVGDKDA